MNDIMNATAHSGHDHSAHDPAAHSGHAEMGLECDGSMSSLHKGSWKGEQSRLRSLLRFLRPGPDLGSLAWLRGAPGLQNGVPLAA